MEQDYITETKISGVFIIERPIIADGRGFFRETFRIPELEKRTGYTFVPQQANHSRSSKNTLRGIHIAPWNKLVTCTSGLIQQIIVDTRPNSPTFGEYFTTLIGEDNWRSVLIPADCGNAFLVLSDTADYSYLVTQTWTAGKERDLIWNDPTIKIEWLTENPEISEKDSRAQTLTGLFPEKFLQNE